MSREAWQSGRTVENFPDGGEPFLPPRLEDEEGLFELYQQEL